MEGFNGALVSGVGAFSYESLMPAGAGTLRYEELKLWLGTANWHGGFCYAPPRPLRGTSPRATFSHSAIGHRPSVYNSARFARGEPALRLSGGHVFVPIAHAGCRRHTKV